MFEGIIKLNRWGCTIFLLALETSTVSAQQLPIGDGAYISQEHCEMAERGELDMVSFTVEKDGRAVSFEETGCLVAAVNSVRTNRYDVELDCREFDTVYQHQLFLDVVSDDHIRVEGEDRWLCKRGFLAGSISGSQTLGSTAELIEAWYDANEGCRGGLGNDPKTYRACDERSKMSSELAELGYCYGKEEQTRSEFDWHPCGDGSLR